MSEETKVENQKLEEMDRMTLELAKQRRLGAIVAAENAELAYKNVILQLYMKYGMSATDSIKEETGEIIKDGALAVKGS